MVQKSGHKVLHERCHIVPQFTRRGVFFGIILGIVPDLVSFVFG
jgi:hypothetical protein